MQVASADGEKPKTAEEGTVEQSAITIVSAPATKKKSNRVRNLLKQVDPEASNQEIDQLFKAVIEILRSLDMAEDPQEDLINALRKIEGRIDYLFEMRYHLHKHFDSYGLASRGHLSITDFEKHV